MSRIGKLPIPVPAGVEVTLDGQDVSVKGPKGTLSMTVAEPIRVTRNEAGELEVTRPDDERESRSLHGLTRTLVNNMWSGSGLRRNSRSWASATTCRRKPRNSSSTRVPRDDRGRPEGITFTVEAHRLHGLGHRQQV